MMTNELLKKLKEMASGDNWLAESEVDMRSQSADMIHGEDIAEVIDELLQLRALRDAGDDEVTLLAIGLSNDMSCGGIGVMNSILKLRDIAIARGRTRTDAVNQAAEWAKECEALQAEIERLKQSGVASIGLESIAGKMVHELECRIENLTAERDEARKELAELRKAPGMEEVDFITKPYCGQSMQSACENHDKIADIARQAIASRDEVEGLMKWLFRNQENQHRLEWAILSDESRRVLEIVEGK